MPTYEDEMIKRARELQRLATRRRKLKRQLKQTDIEIRHVRKMLNAIRQASENRRPDVAPSRLTNGATGIAMPRDSAITDWQNGNGPAPAGYGIRCSGCSRCTTDGHLPLNDKR